MSRSSRARPAALWIQSFLEFLWIGVCTWVLIAIPFVVSGIVHAWDTQSWNFHMKLSGNFFLLAFGVPLEIYRQQNSSSSDSVLGQSLDQGGFEFQGVYSLIPLLLMWLIIIMARQAGVRLARAAHKIALWQLLLGTLLYAVVSGAIVSSLSHLDQVKANLFAAMIIPAFPLLVGLLWGVRRQRGSWANVVGKQFDIWLETVLKRAAPLGKTLVVVVSGVFFISSAVVAISLLLKWTYVASTFQAIGADWTGDLELFVVQLLYIPNLIIGAASWLSGAGVHVGTETILSPFHDSDPTVPLIPILEIVPTHMNVATLLCPVLYVLVGIIAGCFLTRSAQTFLKNGTKYKTKPDEEIIISSEDKVKKDVVSPGKIIVQGFSYALTIAVLSGAIFAFVGWLASGYMGYNYMYFGSQTLYFGLFSAVELFIGLFLGLLVFGFSERSHYIKNKIYELSPIVDEKMLQEMQEAGSHFRQGLE